MNARTADHRILQARATLCAGHFWTISLGGGIARCGFSPAPGLRPVDWSPAEANALQIQLDRELRTAPRGRPVDWVVFEPDGDLLLPDTPALAAGQWAVLSMLLRRRIGVMVRTRGSLNGGGDALVTLARRYPGLLRVEIDLFSDAMSARERWERGCPSNDARLELGQALMRAGVEVVGSIGPLMPFVNDDTTSLRALLQGFARAGIREVTPRWIEDTPGLTPWVEREVSRSSARIMEGWFRMPGAYTGRRRQLSAQMRRRGLDRIHDAAAGIKTRVMACRCGVSWGPHRCAQGPAAQRPRVQLELFARAS